MEIIDYKAQYKLDLKEPEWKAMVEKIRRRDNNTCKHCGCRKKKGIEMNVHHLRYYPNRKPWEYDESDLITLCRDCHKKEHIRIDFEKLERGGYFFHKHHKGVGIIVNKSSDRIWFGLCWSETETEIDENGEHGRLYIQDEALKEDIRPATRTEIEDFWQKVKKYYKPDEISELLYFHVGSFLHINIPIGFKTQDIIKEKETIYKRCKDFIKEKYGYFLLVSDEYFAEFDDKYWKGHTNWTKATFPEACFHVASKKDVREEKQKDNIKNIKFINFNFTGYRAATIDELNEWLDYLYHLDCINEEKS